MWGEKSDWEGHSKKVSQCGEVRGRQGTAILVSKLGSWDPHWDISSGNGSPFPEARRVSTFLWEKAFPALKCELLHSG